MRNLFLILVLAGMAWNTAFSADPSLKIDKYDDAAVQELRLSPEKYLLKNVSLKVKFIAFKSNLSKEAAVSGMKSDTYLWLNVTPAPLQVFMFKKGADLQMKRNTVVTLYCRVLKFNSTRFVRYYLMVERIDTEESLDEKSGGSTAVKPESPVV